MTTSSSQLGANNKTVDLATLRDALSDIENRFKGKDLKQILEPRKMAELEFHNRDRDVKFVESLPKDTYELLHGNKKYYSTVQLSSQFIQDWMKKNVPGKVFLDYACGNGLMAHKAARTGASLAIGLDISDISVMNARQTAAKEGLAEKCAFVQGDCENTGLPSNSIDVILCSGMLHHLDLSFAFPELRRILKPGGKILCVEALDYNPAIKAYRMLTPSMRTDWEKNHILSLRDITFARRFFDVEEVHYWHLLSPLAAFFSKHEGLMKPILSVFNALDKILTKTPLIQLWAWQFTFVLVKRKEA